MSPTATAVTDAEKLTILKLLASGRDAEFVATATHRDRDDVVRIASAHGYPDVAKLAWAADIIEKGLPATARASLPAPARLPSPARPLPAQLVPPTVAPPVRPDPVAQLLADAAASTRKRTRELGVRAVKALDLVRAELAAERDRDAAAVARREAEATTRAEVARLEKRLAELKKGLIRSVAVPPSTQSLGLDAKAIRAWAREAGVQCTVTGRVPRAVVEAYQAAHGDAS